MKGLIRKDVILIVQKYKIYFLFLFIGGLLSIEKGRVDLILGAYLFGSMLAIQLDLITIDKEKNWRKMVESFPVSPGRIVLEKYIVALLFLIAEGIVYLIFSMLAKGLAGKSFLGTLSTFTFLITICCVSISLQIPVFICFGQRVGIFVFLLLGAAASITIIGIRWWGWRDSIIFSTLFHSPINIIFMFATMGLLALSWLISTQIYCNQDR